MCFLRCFQRCFCVYSIYYRIYSLTRYFFLGGVHAVFGNVGSLGSNLDVFTFLFFIAYSGNILCAKNAKTNSQGK